MKKFKLLLSTATTLPIVSAAVSCGVNVETTEKIKQDKFLSDQKRVDDFENIWKIYALSLRYNLLENKQFNENELNEKFNAEFKNKNSQLFKDSYLAFRFYSRQKLDSSSNYFLKKFIEWNKNSYFGNNTPIEEIGKLIEINTIPNEDVFSKIWNVEQTGIKKEINNMLLVKKYFEISSLEELKTITKNKTNKTFEYYANGSDANYDLDHFYLNKYAMTNKYIQLWNRSFGEKNKTYDIFLGDLKLNIDSVQSFNDTFQKEEAQKSKQCNDWETLTSKKISEEVDTKLFGYNGFIKDSQQYGLNWNEKDLKAKKDSASLYGIYDPTNNRLVNFETIKQQNTNISALDPKTNKNIVSYINQIVPVGREIDKIAKNLEAFEKSELKPEDVEKNYTVLSFKNTIYSENLDSISFLFSLKDTTLLETAIDAFAHLGIKIKPSEKIKQIYDLLKNKVWVDTK